VYSFLKGLFTLVLILLGRWKVKGREHIPSSGPLVVVCNHRSYWDPILVGCALNRQVHFMAKAELFSYPLLGTVLNKVGSFPIKRGQSDRNALRTAINLLKENKIIGVFPEGTRSKTENLLPFKPGINMVAYKAQCPILPMAVVNSRKVLLGWFYAVEVRIGKPIAFASMDQRPSSEVLEDLSEQIRQAVSDLLK